MIWNSVPTKYEIKFKAYDLYSHSVDDTNRRTDSYLLAKQPNSEFGYFNTNQFALTSSNTFVGNQTITGSLTVTGNITANTYTITNTILSSGSIYMTGSIETVDHIDFSILANPTHKEGRLHWNDDAKTLDIDTPTADFMIEVGQMMVVRGRNPNSHTLTKGMVVYMSGSSGNRPNFYTASWEDDRRSASTLGIVAQDIASNQTGYVISMGTLRGINTNAYAPGTMLYLSASGQFTSTIPVSPKHEVRLGKVVTQATQGIVYVDIMNGYELSELHDVLIHEGSLKDAQINNGGSTLYRSGSLWTNNDNIRLAESTMILAAVSQSLNFANDTAAAAGGVPLGGLYHTSGSIKIRLV